MSMAAQASGFSREYYSTMLLLFVPSYALKVLGRCPSKLTYPIISKVATTPGIPVFFLLAFFTTCDGVVPRRSILFLRLASIACDVSSAPASSSSIAIESQYSG
jgi:hypothetical protein